MVLIGLILVVINKINRIEKKVLIFFLASFFLYALMTQSFTSAIWRLPLVRDVYDVWRLLAPIALITSVIAGIVIHVLQKSHWNKLNKIFLTNDKNILIGALCLFVILSTILNWGNRKNVPVDYGQIKQAWTSMPVSNVASKVLWTPWVDPNALWTRKLPDAPIDVESGKAEIFQIKRTISDHAYIIYAKTNVVITENTMYFPGWIVKVNNKEYSFSYTSFPNGGLITFHLKKGLYKVEVLLTNTAIQNFASTISIVSFFIIGLVLVGRKLIFKRD